MTGITELMLLEVLGGSDAPANLYTPKILAAFDPISYLPLDDTTGTNANDASTHNLDGTYGGTTGVTLDQAGVNHNAPLFPGANAAVNWLSAGLTAAVNKSEGAISIWFKADPTLWADGTDHFLCYLDFGGSNRINILKENNAGAGRIRFNYVGQGVTKLIRSANQTDVGWNNALISWSISGDALIGYLNGVAVTAPVTGLTVATGSLGGAAIGAQLVYNTLCWKGMLSDSLILDHAPTQAEVSYLAASGGGGTFPFEYPGLVSRNTISSWWSVPKAYFFSNKTYYTGISYTGKAIVGYFDHGADSVNRTEIATLGADDHDTPAILVQTGKPVVIAYCKHAVDTLVRYRIGVAEGALDDFQTEQTLDLGVGNKSTYVQLYREPGTDNLLILTRSDNQYWFFIRSTDYGATWGTPTKIFDYGSGQKGYLISSPNGSTLRLALYGHPTESTLTKIYYCVIHLDTGAIEKKDGTNLGNFITPSGLPLAVQSALTVVYDNGATNTMRLFDINSQDEIAFETWTTDSDAVYKVLFYSGSSWTARSVVAAGAVFGYTPSIHYNGGMSFPNPTAGGTVYLSRESGGTWHIEKYVTVDGGVSWSVTLVESSPIIKLIRPYCPINADDYQVIYNRAYLYADYSTFNADLCGSA